QTFGSPPAEPGVYLLLIMNTRAVKTQENKSQPVANSVSQFHNDSDSSLQFIDNRPEAIAQRKLQALANSSVQAKQSGNKTSFT
ncbi:hypothetical protein, partial [Nitrosomonas supralitoralis]